MSTRLSRDTALAKETIDGEQFLDFTSIDYRTFTTTIDAKYYRVSASDIYRLDMISQKYYFTTELWWFIAGLNGIIDPYVDIEVGTLLIIPPKKDVLTFINQVKKNNE